MGAEVELKGQLEQQLAVEAQAVLALQLKYRVYQLMGNLVRLVVPYLPYV
jgi:hypothetical protein